MAPVRWTDLGGLGEVTWARAAGDAALIAAGTSSGHLYLRRREGAGWRWEHAGRAPGAVGVLGVALLPAAGGSGAVAPAVLVRDCKGDSRAWLRSAGAGRRPWIRLGGPDPDLEKFNMSDIVSATTRHGTDVRHTLVTTSAAGRPWARHDAGPGASWLRVPTDADWIGVELAMTLASVAAGAEPQPHLFALTIDRESFVDQALRVAVLEGSLWTWIDPGIPPDAGFVQSLSAAGFRDADGRLQACAAVVGGDDNAMVLTGSGRDWRWTDLGQAPGPDLIRTAVVVDPGADPRPGAEPVVVASAFSDHIWTRTLTGSWTDLGAAPREAAVDPAAALDLTAAAGRRRVWTAGVSSDSGLWSFESDDTGVRWEEHGRPGSLASLVGAYTDALDIHDKRRVVVHAIDANGALWSCDRWGSPGAGLSDSRGFWTRHGLPPSGAVCAQGAGVFNIDTGFVAPAWVFVVDGDGRLWAMRGARGGWAWIAHGAPPGKSIVTAAAPFPADLTGGQPTVFALADDGRIWMHPAGMGGLPWIDCGGPQGQLISRFVGAAAPIGLAGLLPAAVVITKDGNLWIADSAESGGGSFKWNLLGTPDPAETLIAGIGVHVVTAPADSDALDIVVLGAPSGHVWRLRWARGRPLSWTRHGRPADARLRGGLGTMPDPADPAGCLIAVIGNDQQVWVTRSTAPGTWTRWDPHPDTTTIIAGQAETLLNLPCAVVLDGERRLRIATPQNG
ncbi:hypothetical protein ETD83_03470 [Actinomadura soli]|uniref:Uncharacterized protein n=1 Tax=Actinomadura soli TaxID=2508997 RepID=A0A5C4JIV4_9ACTN|nr:hypothetical protein [Actinomadura soli]TMR06737.1 hypothetical protein ETD83_03470 [Actinomadura soli]